MKRDRSVPHSGPTTGPSTGRARHALVCVARTFSVAAAVLLVGACAQTAGPRPPAGAAGGELAAAESAGWGWAVPVPPPAAEQGINGAHPSLRPVAGLFDCDLKRRVTIRQVPGDDHKVVVEWSGKEYSLDVVRTPSGALRYQSEATGLTWIIIPDKSMLLDTRKGLQLANDCRPALVTESL